MFMPRETGKMSLEEKVQLLMDERDIRALEYRWCRAVDRNDVELMKTCFHPDAVDHHAPFFDGPVEQNVTATFVENNKNLAEVSQYNLGNILIQVDGDVAITESYGWSEKTLHERAENGDRLIRISGLRYLDRLERRDGEWRIAERWFVPDFGFFQQVPIPTKTVGVFVPPSEMVLKPLPSRRDQTDQSYLIG